MCGRLKPLRPRDIDILVYEDPLPRNEDVFVNKKRISLIETRGKRIIKYAIGSCRVGPPRKNFYTWRIAGNCNGDCIILVALPHGVDRAELDEISQHRSRSQHLCASNNHAIIALFNDTRVKVWRFLLMSRFCSIDLGGYNSVGDIHIVIATEFVEFNGVISKLLSPPSQNFRGHRITSKKPCNMVRTTPH